MPKRSRLTDKQIAALPRKDSRYTLPDPEQIGLYLRVPPRTSRAPIAFAAVARDPAANRSGRRSAPQTTWGSIRPVIWLGQLYNASRLEATGDPRGVTVADIAEQWLERHVRKSGLRTAR